MRSKMEQSSGNCGGERRNLEANCVIVKIGLVVLSDLGGDFRRLGVCKHLLMWSSVEIG